MNVYRGTLSLTKSSLARARHFVLQHRGALILGLLVLFAGGGIFPLLGQATANRRARNTREKDSATLIRKRAEWFYHQRAYPLGYIPAGARLEAYRQVAQMRSTGGTFMQKYAAKLAAAIPINMTTWTPIGPQPTDSSFFGLTSGRVTALAADPCDTTGMTAYLGAAQGGVWKTTNGGATWTPLTDGQPSLSTGSLAVDPAPGDCSGGAPSAGGHTGAIYDGTGEENFAYDSFYGAGVLVSHDGGATWTKDNTFVTVANNVITPQNSSVAGPFIGGLAVDPATSGSSQVVLAAVQGISSTAHSGIWRSTDGGLNWTLDPPTAYSGDNGAYDYATSVAFDPNDATGKTAYAALGIPFCTGSNGACFLSGSAELNNGVYKSTDSGQTWTRLTGLDNAITSAGLNLNYGRITIAVGPSATAGNPQATELVVSVADIAGNSAAGIPGNSETVLGVFKSTNGGSTFSLLSNASSPASVFCDDQCFYDMAVAISPTNPNLMFLGGGAAASGSLSTGASASPQCGSIPANAGISTVLVSADGGQTWSDASCDNASGIFIHVDTHSFAFAPSGAVYTGNDGGVWSSSNVATSPGGQSWSNLNSTLNITQFYPGNSISPSNPEVGYAGAQDNGTQKFDPTFNSSNPREWMDTAACGDGAWTAIDPDVPSTVYSTCEAIGQLGTIELNQMDGIPGPSLENWLTLDTPTMDGDNTLFVPPLVLDPSTPQNLYFGTYRVWQSTNGGISWTTNNQDLTGSTTNAGCGGGFCVITTLAVAPNDSNVVYAGTDTGAIWATSTAQQGASANYTEIDTSATPARYVTSLAVSPANAQIAFVGFSGFSSCTAPPASTACDLKGHLWEYNAANAGSPWTNITGNLPDTPVNDIVVDPNDLTNNTLYIATDVGVFGTTNAQSASPTWSVLASGLPHIECTSLKLDNTARVLRVGTHGRGDWDLQLAGLPSFALTGISPTSTTAGAGALTLTVTGAGFTASSVVKFNGTSLATTYTSASQLTAAVPSSAIATPAMAKVTVVDGSNSAGPLNFSIEGPVPTLASISPTTITSTSSNVTLTVTGANFDANSEVVWTPQNGSQQDSSTSLAQLSGGTSTSFSVTVPASLLTTTLSETVPVSPAGRNGPWGFWLLAAGFVAVAGILLLAGIPRKRRLVLSATLTTVALLLLIAGCGGGSSSSPTPPPPPPPPSSVSVTINVYNPGPGGGLSIGQTLTVQ